MLLNGRFLQFRPSQIAAASLILSIKLSNNCDTLNKPNIESALFYDGNLVDGEEVWNCDVEELTDLRFLSDIKPVYCKLINKVRKSTTD